MSQTMEDIDSLSAFAFNLLQYQVSCSFWKTPLNTYEEIQL